MAEVVIGTVASGITIGALGAQIAGGIIKLKSYWDQIRDVPQNLHDQIEELEILNQLLVDTDRDQQRNPVSSLILDPSSNNRCLQYCKRAVNQLSDLMNEIARDTVATNKLRRHSASAKVVWRMEKIDRYQSKLKRSIRLLSFSLQLYQKSVPSCSHTTLIHFKEQNARPEA